MGVLTGFNDLDRILDGGLQNGFLYILGARPSMGKTGFAINVIDHICLRDYRTALMFSLDASRKQLIERFVSYQSGLENRKMRMGQLEKDDWDLLIKGAEAMKEMNLIIDDTPGMKVSEIRKKSIQYKEQYPDLSAVFIDYLQLISYENSQDLKEGITSAVRELKALAKELDLPVFVLSQLPRTTENRKDHRPMLSDLRPIGDIGSAGDVIIFLYRDEYYYRDSYKKGIAEVIVARNPQGAVGCCELKFSPQTVRFDNI